MTDDTLRAECEVWVSANAPSQYNNTEFAWRVRALEAFARAQQAKGLEVAAILCEREAIIDDERGYYGKEMARAIRAKIASAS